MLDSLVSPLAPALSCLARFSAALLRRQAGPALSFLSESRVWAPWNLLCADGVSLGDEAEIYNPSPVTMGSHAIVSQQAYICGATHDYNDPSFPLISFPMSLGAYSWVCARASVSPGVNLGEGAVLGLGSVATRDLEPWTVYAGVPAQPVKQRVGREPSSRPRNELNSTRKEQE